MISGLPRYGRMEIIHPAWECLSSAFIRSLFPAIPEHGKEKA
jgi:hypothetical protein